MYLGTYKYIMYLCLCTYRLLLRLANSIHLCSTYIFAVGYHPLSFKSLGKYLPRSKMKRQIRENTHLYSLNSSDMRHALKSEMNVFLDVADIHRIGDRIIE
jgi:hypothetical protein